MKNEYLTKLKNIISDLAKFAKISGSDFDIASFKNCVYNVKITGEVSYLDQFFCYEINEEAAKKLLEFLNERKIESCLNEIIDFKGEIYSLCEKAYPQKKKNKFRKLKPSVASEKINLITIFKKENRNKETLKFYFLGGGDRKGLLNKILIYFLLVVFGFVFLFPFIYMLSYSFMSSGDLVNPNVTYIPREGRIENYVEAMKVLDFWKTLGETLLVSVLPSLCTAVSCSLAAYGLARYEFKAKKIIFALIIFTFIIPSCLTMLPTVSLFSKMKITGSILSYILPALFGQGIKSAVFILIFYQYFKAIPQSVIEASEIDGANTFKVFLHIAVPSAKTAFLLTILLSIVWYYNETVLAAVFFGSSLSTLPLGLQNFKASFEAIYQGTSNGRSINEAIYMAGTVLNILPLVILYFFTQKHFTQGMDMAGITGE